jgi:arylsulfatase A
MVSSGVSDAMISQVDLLASFSDMLSVPLNPIDGENMWPVIIGKSKIGRVTLIEQGMGSLAIITGNWKYIEPNKGAAISYLTNIETGNDAKPQLYNLKDDIGEKNNLADQYPEKLAELKKALENIRNNKP